MEESKKTIGEIVAEDYRTAKVFEGHGIDFCCGGKVALMATCAEKGIDLATIIEEIAAVKNIPVERSQDYSSWEVSFLADYIINVHHSYLKENTFQIAANTRKIAAVHGTRHPELMEIATIFDKIAIDLTAHLKQEEEEFFPAIKRVDLQRKTGAITTAAATDIEIIKNLLKKLIHEHEEVGDAIHKIRHLAGGYALPGDACNTFMVTYQKLKEFEDDLHKHVHLENNILFLKAALL
ncbi:iron-sulfur cluster repair di-iron protein [Desulfoprunum benzoelyticum]|uniref:Regulator of cell morphogenesis and NO signaling n=1 Tax=Desulfoprunum benzoelyticum TaxID=1506996 RepID=A0A840UXI1_9BACT|nr:iron-sulfur cluster repair di-iron protein [Desulfoprunum benzoelyticum]MBB5349643.1 regulator of cell morphogenesis and NO signaling [Desulfoprunum benzoelyticum]MBM9531711.1 iron-sulfur cluster repair di-iron protein [Desulfoprunum benzoelyticum]